MKMAKYSNKLNRLRYLCAFSLILSFLYPGTAASTVYAETNELAVVSDSTEEFYIAPEDVALMEIESDHLLIMPYASKTASFTLAAGKTNTSLSCSLTKGKSITVSLTYSPPSGNVDFGLLQPDNSIRYVTKNGGTPSHTFSITQSGTHKIYVKNRGSSQISVTVRISY